MKALIVEDSPEIVDAVSLCLQIRWPRCPGIFNASLQTSPDDQKWAVDRTSLGYADMKNPSSQRHQERPGPSLRQQLPYSHQLLDGTEQIPVGAFRHRPPPQELQLLSAGLRLLGDDHVGGAGL